MPIINVKSQIDAIINALDSQRGNLVGQVNALHDNTGDVTLDSMGLIRSLVDQIETARDQLLAALQSVSGAQRTKLLNAAVAHFNESVTGADVTAGELNNRLVAIRDAWNALHATLPDVQSTAQVTGSGVAFTRLPTGYSTAQSTAIRDSAELDALVAALDF